MHKSHFMSRYQLLKPLDEQGFKHPARQSAVLVPLCDYQGQLNILLCKRPFHLRHHPGQICFPGGKRDALDINLKQTALRECEEELGITQTQINVIGEMQSYWTLTGFEIKPYVALIKNPLSLVMNKDEVSSAFLLPFKQLQNPQNWQNIPFKRNSKHYTLKGFNTEQGLLWGATAQILLNLINHVN